jgi:hypothetical protein
MLAYLLSLPALCVYMHACAFVCVFRSSTARRPLLSSRTSRTSCSGSRARWVSPWVVIGVCCCPLLPAAIPPVVTGAFTQECPRLVWHGGPPQERKAFEAALSVQISTSRANEFRLVRVCVDPRTLPPTPHTHWHTPHVAISQSVCAEAHACYVVVLLSCSAPQIDLIDTPGVCGRDLGGGGVVAVGRTNM